MRSKLLSACLLGALVLSGCGPAGRQKFIERNLVGVWGMGDAQGQVPVDLKGAAPLYYTHADREYEFFPDGTYVWRTEIKDVTSKIPGAAEFAKDMIDRFGASGHQIFDEGTWSVTEDGRLRLTSKTMFGLAGTKTGKVWLLTPNCRKRNKIILARMDDGTNLKLERKEK